MRRLTGGVVLLALAGVAGLLSMTLAAPPDRYVRKATWFDTMIAVRQAAAGGKQAAAPKPLPDFGSGQFTVTAWIRTTSGGTIFAKAPEKGRWVKQGKALFVDEARVVFDIGWVGEIRTRAKVTDGEWHHVALVGKGEHREIFVDGRSSARGALAGEPDRKDWPVKVGRCATDFGGRFRGVLDEFRIYARALSANEVAARFEKAPPADDDGLVLHWPFEGDCADASGSRNPAGKTIACAYAAGKRGQALKLTNGCAMLTGGTADPMGSIWAQLRKDFPDEQAGREMAWEREDDIWAGDGSAFAVRNVARRYAAAARRPSQIAERIDALAAAVNTAADLRAVRKLYLQSRRYGQILESVGRFKLQELRSTIGRLYEAAPARRELLSRLDAIEARAAAWDKGPPAGRAMTDWTAAVTALRRDVLFRRNPLFDFDKLLFVKRYTYHSSHFYTDFIDGVGNYGGNLCVLDLKTGEATDLIPEMKGGIFGRFDLHFDADRVVFDWKKSPREGFRLYEIAIDPATGRRKGKVRQLTFPPADEQQRIKRYDNSFLGGTGRMYYHQTDDMHPCYLPDGGICFTSTRCEYGTLCDAPDILSTAVLHRIDADGRKLQKLTNSPVSEFSPSLMADGRILYTRWEYVDKGQLGVKCLWAMRPDGSGSMEVYGNDITFPPTLLHGRQIPGKSDMFVVLGTPHYPQSGIGTVIRLDMSKNIRTREPMTYITPHVDIRQEPGWNHLVKGKWVRHTNGPLYMDPFPLSPDIYLVSHNPDKPWKDVRAYGLYLLDAEGTHLRIHTDTEFSCWQPYPLRTRKRPPVLVSACDPKLASRKQAVCLVRDVYHGMGGIERGTVKHLRIMEQFPRPWAARRVWDKRSKYGSHTQLVSRGSVLAAKVLHGVVPVCEDGSAHFLVPADRNIYFEALDENYMELQRERTYVNYRPGEERSCVGCHETPNDPPPTLVGTPIAFQRPPDTPAPQPGDKTAARVIHYPTDVQPVLDKHCVRCHGSKSPKGKLDLTGTLTTHFSRSYESILNRRLVKTFDEGSDWGGTPYSPPKTVGSHASRFIAQVRKGCSGNDRKLPLADFVKLTTWVDANAQYYGSYWGRRNLRYKDHPNFRPVPTLEQALSTQAPLPDEKR